MNDDALLMLVGSGGMKVKPGTIGIQGGLGFGGGLYPGDPADLTAIGLSPMPNNADPTKENFGSYIHTNGSVMLFVPAFCYRIGNPAAPSYTRDKDNALEIRDASLGETDGFILHRAFIDGGQQKLGFFIDKYLCSKDSTGRLATSVKNGDPIALNTSYVNSSAMPNCKGQIKDAITLGRARGNAYSCASGFMYSAIAMLSLAHGQAAKSAVTCAWFDPSYQKNYPKGNNSNLKDYDEPSLTFVQGPNSNVGIAKTGSASNISKTTHTGQVWGVTDVNGNMSQPCLGIRMYRGFPVAKESVSMHDFTAINYRDTSLFENTVSTSEAFGGASKWGDPSQGSFFKDALGNKRALCGLIPTVSGVGGTPLFGNDYIYTSDGIEVVLLAAGSYFDGQHAGVFCRQRSGGWDYGGSFYGFRVGGYAK